MSPVGIAEWETLSDLIASAVIIEGKDIAGNSVPLEAIESKSISIHRLL